MALTPWSQLLQTSGFGGIEFECISTNRQGGVDSDDRLYPEGNGASIEPRGLKQKRVDLVIPILEDDYPDLMNQLLAKFDEGTVQEYVDNIFGSMQALPSDWTCTHDVNEGRDYALIRVTMKEHNPNASTPFIETTTGPALANASRAAADDALVAADQYEASLDASASPEQADAPDQARDASAAATSAANTLEDSGDVMSASEIAATVNTVINQVNVITLGIDDFTTPEAYALGAALQAMLTTLSALGDALINAKPPLINDPIPAGMSLLALTHAFYADSGRAEEVLALNSIADPMEVPVGTRLQRYAV